MQLYDRGIRRRLAPMLDNDRRRLELAFSLLFSLPGTPMMQYGDEIGIGDDLRCPSASARARRCSGRPSGTAASRAPRSVVRPVIDDPIYGYQRVNVADAAARSALAAQLDRAHDPHAQGVSGDQLGRLLGAADERARGARDPLRLARDVAADAPQLQQRQAQGAGEGRSPDDDVLVEVFDRRDSKQHNDGAHRIALDGYAWRWYRVGAPTTRSIARRST